MANPKKNREFNKAMLEKLGQPFSVTVEQDVGGRRTPIDLPPVEPGVTPGKGYNPDAAEALGAVLPKLGGGGLYICKALDDAGNMETWEWWFDPAILPRRATSAVAAAAVAHQTPPVMLSAPQQAPGYSTMVQQPQPSGPLMPMSAPAFQPFAYWHQGQAPQQVAQAPTASAFGPWDPRYPSPVPAPSSPPAPRDPFSDPLWQEREKSIRLEYDMKLQQMQVSARAEIATAMQRLDQHQSAAQQAAVAAARPAVDPVLESRVAAAERRAEEAENRARAASEKAERDADRAALIAMVQALEARMTSGLEAVIAKVNASPAGPDPTISLLLETVKANAEMNRETLRTIADSAKDAARGQMTLADVLAMVRQINDQSGATTITQQLSTNYSSMLGMVREIIELNNQMRGPGENPLIGMGTEAIAKVSEGVQSYIQSKRDEAIAKENAAAVRAQAAAASNAAVAQAQAQAAQARQPAMAPPPAAANTNGTPAPGAAPGATVEEAPAESGGETEAEAEEVGIDEREEEIFGPAAESVLHLRAGVATGQLNALQVAQAVAQGAARLRAMKITPPVFKLYEERVYNQVIEALLPEAPPTFRREVVEILNSAARMQAEQAVSPPS